MAKRVFSTVNVTFVAQAAGSIITNASSYMGLRSTLAGQLVDILEILISGMGSASTIAALQYGRQSTNSATETALAAPNADGGETVLFADSSAGQSGTGALNAHIIYEPY